MIEQELVAAPSLAEIHKRQCERAPWLKADPLPVDADLWNAARSELDAVLKDRGWSISSDEGLSRLGVDNFLFYGLPVVMA